MISIPLPQIMRERGGGGSEEKPQDLRSIVTLGLLIWLGTNDALLRLQRFSVNPVAKTKTAWVSHATSATKGDPIVRHSQTPHLTPSPLPPPLNLLPPRKIIKHRPFSISRQRRLQFATISVVADLAR